MKYEKSLTEVFEWKEESGNELYNMTIQERFKLLRESEIRRKYLLNIEQPNNQVMLGNKVVNLTPSPIL